MQHQGGFSAKAVNHRHGTWSLYSKPSSTLKLLYWGQRVPRVVGCSCTQPPCQAATTNTQWIYHGPLPCLPACFLCFSFATVALLLWLICAQFFIVTQSREAAQISEQNQRSSTSKFVSTAVAIHHRQQALHSPQHAETYTKIQIA